MATAGRVWSYDGRSGRSRRVASSGMAELFLRRLGGIPEIFTYDFPPSAAAWRHAWNCRVSLYCHLPFGIWVAQSKSRGRFAAVYSGGRDVSDGNAADLPAIHALQPGIVDSACAAARERVGDTSQTFAADVYRHRDLALDHVSRLVAVAACAESGESGCAPSGVRGLFCATPLAPAVIQQATNSRSAGRRGRGHRIEEDRADNAYWPNRKASASGKRRAHSDSWCDASASITRHKRFSSTPARRRMPASSETSSTAL